MLEKLNDKLTTKYLKIYIAVLCIMLYLSFLIFTSKDSDMYFIITGGKEIVYNHNFNTLNSNIYDIPIIMQQWLYSVILLFFVNLGSFGYIVFTLIQDILLCIVSYIFLNNKTHNKYISFIIPIIELIIFNYYLINVRPQICTMTLLVLELIILEKYKQTKHIQTLFWIIPILILSANLHQALFLYHMYILIPYYIHDKKLDIKLILITPIYLVCSVLTPYTLDGSLYIFRAFKSQAFKLSNIQELQPINFDTLEITNVTFICVIIICIWLICIRHIDYITIFYVLSTSLLCLTAIRHIYMFYISILFLSVHINFSNIINDISTKFRAVCLIFALLFITLITIGLHDTYYKNIKNESLIYSTITSTITNKDVKIYNMINIGSYLEYIGYNNVYIDARPELYTTEFCNRDILTQYYNILYLTKDNKSMTYKEIQNELSQFDYLIIMAVPDNSLYNYIIQHDYKITSINKKYIIVEIERNLNK